MRKLLLFSLLTLTAARAGAQITITAADMPVAGDTLRYSAALALGANLNLNDSGANKVWNYSSLTPIFQGVDSYKTVIAVNPAYAVVIQNPLAFGYKVTDTLSFTGLPVSVTEVYTFFGVKSNPSRFVAEGFGAKVGGIPTPAAYANEDEWYYFPLAYGREDSSTFRLDVTVLGGLATLKQIGYRKTKVDGWGTITTPYHTTPKSCIRVRHEIVEVDSVFFGPTVIGLPRHTFEYKWLANGEHYPALWVTGNIVAGNEVPTAVRYRDMARTVLSVGSTPKVQDIKTWPNPAADGIVHIDVPASWQQFGVEVFDMQGRKVSEAWNARQLDLRSLTSGQYLIRIQSGDAIGFARIVR